MKSIEKIESVFTATFCRETQCVPAELNERCLTVYSANPMDIFLKQRLEILLGCSVDMRPAGDQEISDAFKKYSSKQDKLKGVSEGFKLEIAIGEGEEQRFQGLEELGDSGGPIVTLINTIISTALKKRVSDIHIECYEKSVKVKYRIDGVLYPATEDLDPVHKAALASRLKVMAELDIAETRVPQDGRFKLRLGARYIDFRLSVVPSLFGENIVIRILDNQGARDARSALSIDDMGFSGEQRNVFIKAINEPHGMVLITGPTGSGKTTTLYAAIAEINNGMQKIVTIEDPVEYQLDGIMQIPVNAKKGLTFASGLRSILRHDPDRILVGEIRDKETADIAIQSALTGHLVFSSVHANNAIDVLARLQNIGVGIGNCLSAINCIVSQRLLRLNCTHCARRVTYDNAVLESSGLALSADQAPMLMRGQGCDNCAMTGYSGRTMICEMLMVTDAVRENLLESGISAELLRKMELVGNTSLRLAALQKVHEGRVSLEEANRVTFN